VGKRWRKLPRREMAVGEMKWEKKYELKVGRGGLVLGTVKEGVGVVGGNRGGERGEGEIQWGRMWKVGGGRIETRKGLGRQRSPVRTRRRFSVTAAPVIPHVLAEFTSQRARAPRLHAQSERARHCRRRRPSGEWSAGPISGPCSRAHPPRRREQRCSPRATRLPMASSRPVQRMRKPQARQRAAPGPRNT